MLEVIVCVLVGVISLGIGYRLGSKITSTKIAMEMLAFGIRTEYELFKRGCVTSRDVTLRTEGISEEDLMELRAFEDRAAKAYYGDKGVKTAFGINNE